MKIPKRNIESLNSFETAKGFGGSNRNKPGVIMFESCRAQNKQALHIKL